MPEPVALPPLKDAPLALALLPGVPGTDPFEAAALWCDHLASLRRDFRILLVVHESYPQAALPEPSAPADPRVTVLTYPGPEGDGEAIRTALASAHAPIVAFSTADSQYRPNDMDALLNLLDEVHLVCGYRVHQPIPAWLSHLGLVRRIITRIVLGAMPPRRDCWLGWAGWGRRWLARWIFGLRLSDVECRLRLFRREVLEQFPVQSQGTFAHIEMLAKANHLGSIMAEAPVSWVPPPRVPYDPSFRRDALLVFRHPAFHDPIQRPAAAAQPVEGA